MVCQVCRHNIAHYLLEKQTCTFSHRYCIYLNQFCHMVYDAERVVIRGQCLSEFSFVRAPRKKLFEAVETVNCTATHHQRALLGFSPVSYHPYIHSITPFTQRSICITRTVHL